MENDRIFLIKAIELAAESIKNGGGPFGAVIVKDNTIISQAYNMVVLTNDPTAHAEVAAIRKAASLLGTHDLDGCTLYTSCEPCPMCLGAIYWAGIKKVVYASDRKDAQQAGFNDNLIYQEILLTPSDRRISFIRIADVGGDEVFRKWIEFENRIQY